MRKVVLITGVSSGIGKALFLRIPRKKYIVIGTARGRAYEEVLKSHIRENDSYLLPLDITDASQREQTISKVLSQFGTIHTLINNAGISYRSVIEHMSEEDEILQLTTNYTGPFGLIRLVLPEMRRVRSGCIINISSVGGMMAQPTMGSYSASKFALEGATEALWYEMKPWGVKVCLVQPGFVHSNSFMNVYLSEKARDCIAEKKDYVDYYNGMSRFIEKCMNRAFATPESIADVVIKVMQHTNPPLRVPATFDAHLFAFMRRAFPRRLYHKLLYSLLPNVKYWGERKDK
jgi:short-subunit dehydrogenase